MVSPNAGAWWNFAFLILTGVAAGSVKLAGVPAPIVEVAQIWAGNGAWVITAANLVFHLYSSPQPGPMVGTNPVKLLFGGK